MTNNRKMPDLSKKHFEFIAGVIANMSDPIRRTEMAIHFAEECRKTNKQFKYDTFIRACKLEGVENSKAKTVQA